MVCFLCYRKKGEDGTYIAPAHAKGVGDQADLRFPVALESIFFAAPALAFSGQVVCVAVGRKGNIRVGLELESLGFEVNFKRYSKT